MRTRVRLLLAFVVVYAVLAVATGAAVLGIMTASLRATAEARVAQVLAEGGFSLSPSVLARMQTLTGYTMMAVASTEAVPTDWLAISQGDTVLAVDYRTVEHQRLVRAVVGGTAVALVVGVLVFALVAWALARQFATPLERLARAARGIGSGDLEQTVEVGGSGEVRALGLDLEQMRRRLCALVEQRQQAERLATVGLFTATIAHEVRNPLSAVRLTIQLLRRRQEQPQAAGGHRPRNNETPGEAGSGTASGPAAGGTSRWDIDPHLALVEEELERLDLIVDELLAFSKGIQVVPERVELRTVVAHVLRLLQRQAEHAGVTLNRDGDAEVRADPARLRQLLLNLVLNAIQAQHGGGEVIVHIRRDGLSVEDHGPGVSADLAPHLFTPFASGRVQGTGLGLHLAQAIAEAHGAHLQYERREGRTFFHLLGLRCEPAAENAEKRKGL